MLSFFKKIVLWSYGRTTWQYDVLCVLILAFVFLTPKSWFDQGELDCRRTHQNGLKAAGKLIIRPARQGANPDAHALERCARRATGRPDARLRSWQAVRNPEGRLIGFEVDLE